MVVLAFCIDKQMQEKKKYFQQKFLLFKCHLTVGIPFGGKSLFLPDKSDNCSLFIRHKEYHKQLAADTG